MPEHKTIDGIKADVERYAHPFYVSDCVYKDYVQKETALAAIDEAVQLVEDKWATGMRQMTCAVLFEYGDCPSTCDPNNKDDWCHELYERVEKEFKELDEKYGTNYLGMEVEA